MNTMILDNSKDSIKTAKNILLEGGIIAVPTETVYGLIADPENIETINNLYKLKRRSKLKPVSLLVNNIDQAIKVWDLKNVACMKLFLRKFWPGGLTVVNKKRDTVNNILTAGENTIGIRFSDHEIINGIIELFDSPIAATSANVSGENDLNFWEEVYSKFDGKIDAVFKGSSKHGVSSTVIEIKNNNIEILREGIIKKEELIS